MQIIHKGGFYGLYAALTGDIQTVIFLCIYSTIIIQTVYTTQHHPVNPSPSPSSSALHIYHKAKYTPKDKSRCV